MVISNYYDSEIHVCWVISQMADGYTLYRQTAPHLYTAIKDVKTNYTVLYGIESGETIKIKPYRLVEDKKVYDLPVEKFVVGDDEYSDNFEFIINSVKSSANIFWKNINGADNYKIYLDDCYIGETTDNEFTVKFLPVGGSNIFVEAYSAYALILKSDIVALNNEKLELWGINCENDKILLYWNKVKGAEAYRIFQKQPTGEFCGFISSNEEKIYIDASPDKIHEYKVKPYVTKNGQREYNGCSAKCKVKINSSFAIKLIINEAYDNKIALSWLCECDADGFDVLKNNEFYMRITDGLAHIALLEYDESLFQVKGFKYFYDEIIYTSESDIISPDNFNGRLNLTVPDEYKLSVIIPAYNSEDYISRSISTVLGSTIDDVELVIVDDGSSDKTRDIITWYADKYPTYVKKIFKENSGVADTRNAGIKFAHGKYIAFMDNDDMIRPDSFKVMYETIEKTGADIAVSPLYRIDNDKYIIRHKLPFQENVSIDIEDYLKLLFSSGYSNIGIWNKLYKSVLVKEHLLGIQMYEDVAWTPFILSWANKFCYVDKIGYEWDRKIRTSTFSNVLSSRTPEEKFNDRLGAVKFFFENGNQSRRECLVYLMAKRLYGQGIKAKYSKYFEAISDLKTELSNNKFLLEDKEFYNKILPLIKN